MQQQPNNVTQISEKQAERLAHFTIQATLGGFPITIEGDGRAGDLKVIIERPKLIGAEPPAIQASATTEPTKQAGPPLCPAHGTAMKEGRRGHYCPKKVGDGYCRETA